MAVATFDTLKFANTLKAAGVPPAQAEAEAHALGEALQVNFKELVTKDDLKREIDDAKKELKHELKEVEQRLNAKIDLLKWMVGTTLGALFLVAGLIVRVMFMLGR